MDRVLLTAYSLEEQGAPIKTGADGSGLPNVGDNRVPGGSETGASPYGGDQAITEGNVNIEAAFKIVESHHALIDEHCSRHLMERALFEGLWDIRRIGMVVDTQPRAILARTIEEKGAWKQFEHLLGMLLVVLPGLLVANELFWIICDGFEADDLCILAAVGESLAIFGDEIAELALRNFGDALGPQVASGAVGTLDGGVEKGGLLLRSIALVGHERGDSLLKNEITLGLYLEAEKGGKNRRVPDGKRRGSDEQGCAKSPCLRIPNQP